MQHFSKMIVPILAFLPVLCMTEEVTPVQKVIQLMEGMQQKAQKDKVDEQHAFAAFKQFCTDTEVEKKRDIAEASDRIDVLTADIEKYVATIEKLTKEIADHDADIAAWTGDQKAATIVRDIEKADYEKLHKDYSESVDALQRAIEVLKKQAYDRPQAFAQVSSLHRLALIPASAKQALDMFLQSQDEQPLSAPEAAGYEFQSQGVIDMLKKLLEKFTSERTAIEKKEMSSKQAYKLLMSDMTEQINDAKKDRTDKTEFKTKTQESKAAAEDEIQDLKAARESDKKYLADLVATCAQKASAFESRQELRAEELVAIGKAIEIISSEAVKGNSEKHLPQFVQQNGPVLAMLRSGSQNQLQSRAAEYLRERASKLNSRVLSTLAVRAASDPFVKVKKMIKDLIVRLMEEANEEAEHKSWCDAELSTNEQTRKEKTDAVESLHAEVDQLEASIAKLGEDIAELTAAVAALDAAMEEATTLRTREKARNKETIKDSQDAQSAVARALVVLKEFYAKAADATALLQQQPEIPEIFDESYKGLQSENGGVVGMLEVIESDFARLEADTKAAEATSQKEYDTFMADSKADKAAKTTEIEHKTAKKQDETQAHTTASEDLQGTQEELDASLAYFDKLKPSCIYAGVSYDDRVARRQEELESLQQALQILEGEQ